jgi:lipopolysaccharide exporter
MLSINKTIRTITHKLRGDSLKKRSARGVMVLATGTIVERFLRLLRNMILARLLAPDDFGLMAIVLAASLAFEAFADVGVKQSVIQNKRGAEEEYLNVAWWFQSVRGLVLFLVAFLAAPLISSFYRNPGLLVLLRVTFFGIVFNGLMSPRVHVLEKKIQLGKWVFLYQGSGLVGTLVSLGIAFFVVRSVWALVIGFLVESGMRCLLSFVLCPFLPRISIDRDSLSDILHYTYRMFGIPILAVIAFQLDVLVLGKILPPAQVGMYWLALQLALQTNGLYFKVIYPILLPVFAEKQDDKQSICGGIIKITLWNGILGIPITTFLIVCADAVMSIVYGPKFAAVAVPFGIICIYSFVSIQGSALAQVYFAVGKPHLHRRFVVLRLAILATLIYPGSLLFGLVGAAVVVLLANSIGLCMQVVWMKKPIGLRFVEYASCWLPGLGLALIVLVPVIVLRFFNNGMLFLNIVVGGLACLIACIVGFLVWGHNGDKHTFLTADSQTR